MTAVGWLTLVLLCACAAPGVVTLCRMARAGVRDWRVKRAARRALRAGDDRRLIDEVWPALAVRGEVLRSVVPVVAAWPLTWSALDAGECPSCGHDWERGEVIGRVGNNAVCLLCVDTYQQTGRLP